MRVSKRVPLLLSLLALSQAPVEALLEDWAPGWTERLGLSFYDDCQEHTGVWALVARAESWLWGRKGKQRIGQCESRTASCAEGVAVTGLQVRSVATSNAERVKLGARELYDFKLRCDQRWQGEWLGLRFDTKGEAAQAGSVCPDGTAMTGVQVMRGRAGKRDYYNFKLRCDRAWAAPLMLPFESLKETRAASCPKHRQVSGVKVHRGFQDWGDVDTYEFQLLCLPVSSAPAKGALHGALASPAGAASEPARGVGWPGRGSALDVLSSTSLADLLTMSAEQVAQTWELVTSLLSDPPTVMQATFSDAGAEAREL